MPQPILHYTLVIFCLFGLNSTHAQSYFLNGDAQYVGDDCYLLTESLPTQNGTVWYADQINLAEPFDLEFTMNFGTNNDNGADGIVFVLQTVGTSAIGESGGGIGFGGFDPSFGVEFDTWQNGENGDLLADHIAMISNGDVSHVSVNAIAGPVQAAVFSANIEDGIDHVVRITWDPEINLVEVFFDCFLRQTVTVDLIAGIFNGQTLVYWGFTAATGGAWNNQQVCLQENIVSTGPDVSICAGSGTTVVASGDPEGTYNWTPEEFLDDPSSQTPFASPPVSTMFYVEYFNLCGDPLTDSVFVEVGELEAFISTPQVITCDNLEVNLTGSSNFGNEVEFLWTTQDGNIVSGANASTASVNQSGSYTLEVNVDDLCFDEINVEVLENLIPFDADAGADNTLDCDQTSVSLSGDTDGSDFESLWVTSDGQIIGNATSLDIQTSTAGTYSLIIVNPENGCSSSDEVVVTDNTYYPIVDAGRVDTLSCADPIVFLNDVNVIPDEAATFEWTTIEGNILSGANTSTLEVNAGGMYYITVTLNGNGCSGSDSVFVDVEENVFIETSDLVMPNVFSPNNDGSNETFRPFLKSDPNFNILEILSNYDIKIYNRWGVLVHERIGTPVPWDGRVNGEPTSDGAYYYLLSFDVECSTQKNFELKGSFEILK